MTLLTHTSHEFEAELRQLKGRLLAMGGRCEQMILWAVNALEDQNVQLAEDVMRADRQMNEDEMAVDEMAMRMLALRQPVGRDLRFAITAVKVVTDLERIGDEAVNLAERASELAASGAMPAPAKRLSEMAMLAKNMLPVATGVAWEAAFSVSLARETAPDRSAGDTSPLRPPASTFGLSAELESWRAWGTFRGSCASAAGDIDWTDMVLSSAK